MSFGNTTENDILELVFKATALSWAAASNLTVHLHTGDPGEGGTSGTSACAYTSYAPVNVARSGSGFTVTGNSVSNAALIQFPQCTGSSETATHFSVTPQGSTQILIKGALSSSLAISSGIQPQFAAGALTATLD
jgi:hypothetical protein